MAAIPLVRIVEDTLVLPSDVLYIDPNNPQIQGDITFSVHLVLKDDAFGTLEYNTIYEETFAPDNPGPPIYGTNGRGELMPQIAIQLWERAPSTYIIKPKKPKIDTTQIWKLPDDYDVEEIYTYEWVIEETPPAPIPATITGGQNTKEIEIYINARGFMFLKCYIYRTLPDGTQGCPRIVRVMQEVGFAVGSVVISRNRLT